MAPEMEVNGGDMNLLFFFSATLLARKDERFKTPVCFTQDSISISHFFFVFFFFFSYSGKRRVSVLRFPDSFRRDFFFSFTHNGLFFFYSFETLRLQTRFDVTKAYSVALPTSPSRSDCTL